MKFSELEPFFDKVVVENAIVTSASIGVESHGILTGWIGVEFRESTVQSFGGYNLQVKGDIRAAEWIIRCMDVVGVEAYEQIKGKPIRASSVGGSIIAIGHFLRDSWFCPRIEFGKK